MNRRVSTLLSLALAAMATALAASPALAAPTTVWKLSASSQPTNFAPGGKGHYLVVGTNVGSKASLGAVAFTATLPAGLIPKSASAASKDPATGNFKCLPDPVVGQTVTCTAPANRASGSGDITAGSTKVTALTTTTGAFATGFEIQGTGIPAGTRILSQSPTELTLSNEATLTASGVELLAPSKIHPGYVAYADIAVEVAAAKGEVKVASAEISGGGGALAQTTTPITVTDEDPLFDFFAGEEGFKAPLIDLAGLPVTEAGSHQVYEAISDLNFPTIAPGGFLTGAGHVRDVTVEFPPGLLANPAAIPARCSEAQLTSEEPGCPVSSQVGTVSITTSVLTPEPSIAPLYNMVPPPGTPASFGFNALGVGIFPHITASIRSASDYGASGHSKDLLARGLNPILNASVELWGNPADPAHDFARAKCLSAGQEPPCKAEEPQPDAFLAMPTSCAAQPLRYRARADSWEEPAPPFTEREALYESADLKGNPVEVAGCNELKFEPKLTIKPTTNLTESPTGLIVELHQPQDTSLAGRSAAPLRNATVTLPAGLEANAAQADGLGACSPAQIGMLTAVGEAPGSFAAAPSSCPDAAKLGTVEVRTPLLAQYDAENKVERDPTSKAVIPEPLFGSVYLAEPFQNPFGSLLAIYLTVEDPKTGTFAKLAGKVEPDPLSGQLTTRFEENPQLPLEDVRIELFGGNRASLQTPPSCGPHATTAHFVPWSAPDAPTVDSGDAFALSGAPGGGPCPAALPNAQSFTAGTTSPLAGTFSPLISKLSRADGTQRISSLELRLPGGLSGRLAGIATCSEAQIAQAASRSQPNGGALEVAAPSCPAASRLGRAVVGAGAGPTPYRIQGTLHLAGPYRGAPLSVIVITPAIAGPFDLGTVVVRAAAFLDSVTGQVRIVSDPFPRILHGIPVDVRSVAVDADRQNFTLNPTSCEPKSFVGSVTSTLGQVAPLSDYFQVADCARLAYKPKLTARLFGPIHRGGHPRFRSVFTARPGDANTARVSFALPKSEFIDQSHFRTICTRVQFAANQCPPGSIYGYVRAKSPLVDYVAQGPIYLRSSNNELPDAVAVLRGPPHQPVQIELIGRVDSVNGGIRTTFETVPDLPVTKAVITLQGAKKGLFQNSTNICAKTFRATAKLSAQNGRKLTLRPKMVADCKGKKGRKGKGKGAKAKGGR